MYVICSQKRHATFTNSLIPFLREIGLRNFPPTQGGGNIQEYMLLKSYQKIDNRVRVPLKLF